MKAAQLFWQQALCLAELCVGCTVMGTTLELGEKSVSPRPEICL